MALKRQTPAQGGPAASIEPLGKGAARQPSADSSALPYCEWSDLDLVACLSSEGGDAYAELYRRHSASVAAVARMILVNDERCQDVVAEVFVGLWFSPEKFESSRGSLLTFLRMKARGRSIDIIRTEVARRRREESGRDSPNDNDPDSDIAMIGAEAALVVRDALALLPPNQREPIYLAFFSGLSYHEVARRLDLPEGTVKGRIRAGMRRLQGNDQLLRLREADTTMTPGESAKPSLT